MRTKRRRLTRAETKRLVRARLTLGDPWAPSAAKAEARRIIAQLTAKK